MLPCVGRPLQTDEVLVASHNAGKVREVAALFEPYVRRIRSAGELGLLAPVEDGPDFEANAAIKARAAAEASGCVAVADDSGLVVPALDGAPGLRSARWAGPERDFGAAMRRVHDALRGRGLETEDAPAEMVSALALAWPDGHAESFEGRVEGALVWPPRGERGFGYEPLFRPGGATRTYGEMPRSDKLADDARARAFAALRRACLRGR